VLPLEGCILAIIGIDHTLGSARLRLACKSAPKRDPTRICNKPSLGGLCPGEEYMPMMWELFNEPFDIRPDGMVHVPGRAGLGLTLRADALERFRYVDGPEFEF
jgi:hypothetical protein